jgi:hypothetical protein
VKVFLSATELWPRYCVYEAQYSSTGQPSLEIDEATLKRWREAEAAFEAMQDEIRTMLGRTGQLKDL